MQQLRKSRKLREARIKDYLNYRPNAKYVEGAGLWQAVKVDVALPCATQNELLIDDAKALVANGTIASLQKVLICLQLLRLHNIYKKTASYFAPGKASNAGGVATSALEMSQNSQRLSWTFEEVDEKLHNIMITIYKNSVAAAKEYNCEIGGKTNLVAGANIAGFMKVADAMMAQGVC